MSNVESNPSQGLPFFVVRHHYGYSGAGLETQKLNLHEKGFSFWF
jgi:hypothetical protein